jgi:acyl-coenzyme A thioesterase PaaI-like protein
MFDSPNPISNQRRILSTLTSILLQHKKPNPTMVVRIQYRHLARLAQRQGPVIRTPTRYIQPRPSTLAAQYRQLQPFSTSPTQQQDPKPAPPVPETPPTASTITGTTAPPLPTPPTTTTTEPNPTPKTKRIAPRIIFATAFLLLGLAGGSSLRLLLTPPSPPEPDSEADAYTTQILHDQASQLPVVAQLSADPSWESWDAYESLTAEHKAQHITAGALRGSRGVGGYQRVFCHKLTGEMVSVIFFGAATAGWPGVVHGGCLATVLDESCGRAAFKKWGGRQGLTARLGLEYKRVTLANGFYVVRARVRSEEELPEKERGKAHYKCFVDATVEDAVTGRVGVTAEALFVALGGKIGNGAGKMVDEHVRF